MWQPEPGEFYYTDRCGGKWQPFTPSLPDINRIESLRVGSRSASRVKLATADGPVKAAAVWFPDGRTYDPVLAALTESEGNERGGWDFRDRPSLAGTQQE